MDRIRSVVVVEDFALVSDGLVSLLRTIPDLRVAGVAANLRDAHTSLLRVKPDLLLTELLLDDGSAVELLRVVRRERLATRVIVVTRLHDTFALTEALSAGAHGYVLKSQPSAELFEAIEVVSAGERYVSPAAEGKLSQSMNAAHTRAGLELLSSREIEILRMIAAGTTSAEISRHLGITTKTIDTHRSNMYRKLSLRNQVDLVRFAAMHGIAVTTTAPVTTAAPLPMEESPGTWSAVPLRDGARRR